MWSTWATVRRQYAGLCCSQSVGLIYRLFRLCVPPAASYACEIWGLRKASASMKKSRQAIVVGHANVLRAITGLRKNTPHPILFAQVPEGPIQDQWLVRSAISGILFALCLTLPSFMPFGNRPLENTRILLLGGSWICLLTCRRWAALYPSLVHRILSAFPCCYSAWSSLVGIVTRLSCMLASSPVFSLPGEFYCAPICIGFQALLGVWRSSLLWISLFQLRLSSPF